MNKGVRFGVNFWVTKFWSQKRYTEIYTNNAIDSNFIVTGSGIYPNNLMLYRHIVLTNSNRLAYHSEV